MAIATTEADQKKLRAEKGVKMPRLPAGANKYPPPAGELTKPEDDRSRADTSKKEEGADDAQLIGTAKKRFALVGKVEDSNRTEGSEDLKFLKGDQWSSADAAERAADGRPCITENRLPTFANQITNDQRQNRPSINISPMGDKASKKDAKMLRGMIRAIERDSCADIAYDTAFQSAVHNGWGYARVLTEYEYEKSDNRVIVVKPISNPFTVYLDPGRTPFMLDAKWGFISELLARDEFEREYPNASQVPWAETGVGENDKDWVTPESIRVAEYYYFDYENRELIRLSNGHIGWDRDLDPGLAKQVADGKIEVLSRRTVHVKRLKWCKITSVEVLERKDCDGSYVPIIECVGTLLDVNGKQTKKGIVRDAKGPQRMANYYATLLTENIALQPKAPFIMEEGQVEGHEDKWKNANRKSFSYLLYKGVNLAGKPAPPPARQQFQGPPAGILSAQQTSLEALKAVTGIRFDATMSERMQDESGKAIRELNNNANLGAYHYIDNFGRFLKNIGLVLVDLIPPTYDTKRIVSVLGEDGAEDRVMIDPNMDRAHHEVLASAPDNPNGKLKLFNPKIGRYQVTVTIGPSYATKRIEAMESMVDFLRVYPQGAAVIADLIASNSDWPGAEQIAERLAKSIPPNLLSPSREDMSPQTQALIQGLQEQIKQSQLQMQAMAKELADRQKDREVLELQIATTYKAKSEKTERDFEAAIMKLGAQMEEVAAKREATFQGTIGRQMAELAKAIAKINAPAPASAV